jgi:flagellar motor switch protein FliG
VGSGVADERLTGRRKAAILCVALGPTAAVEIFRRLPADVVEQLTVEMARTPVVEPQTAEVVFDEIRRHANAGGWDQEGGLRFARQVLEKALGADRAAELLARLDSIITVNPFDFLRKTSPDQIYAFLRHEAPQTISLVLANLPDELSAKVLENMPSDVQAQVATCIARMTNVSPEVIKEVAAVMEAKLEVVVRHEVSQAGGVRSLAQILSSSDRATERNVLETLEQEDPELADAVRALLFVFEDLMKLDDRAIQLVLKEVEAKDLALALRGTSEAVQERITSNMSSRAAEMLREEMEYMPPQRRRAVEEAQAKIVAVVRRLEDAGALTISRGEDDADEMIV